MRSYYAAETHSGDWCPEVENMKRPTNWIAFVAGAALIALTAGSFQAQQSATPSAKDEVALRAAMEKETVHGDLKGAIEQYKKLAQSKDRSIAARALIRMASSEARKRARSTSA
jgi:hypothetical protein